MAGVNFKAFDLGGHEIARRVWKDYYAKVRCKQTAACCKVACAGPRSERRACYGKSRRLQRRCSSCTCAQHQLQVA